MWCNNKNLIVVMYFLVFFKNSSFSYAADGPFKQYCIFEVQRENLLTVFWYIDTLNETIGSCYWDIVRDVKEYILCEFQALTTSSTKRNELIFGEIQSQIKSNNISVNLKATSESKVSRLYFIKNCFNFCFFVWIEESEKPTVLWWAMLMVRTYSTNGNLYTLVPCYV